MATKNEAKDWAREHLRGLWGTHWTPLSEDFQIDEPALREHIRRTLELEPDGLSAAGLMCEIWHLALDERKRIGEIVFDEVGGRVPLYFSATHHSTEDTLDLVHHAQEIGYDSVLVWPPYEHANSDREIYKFFEYVERRSDIAIVAYSTPHSGRLISPETLAEIARLQGICGSKYVTWTFSDYVRAEALAGNRIVVSNPFEENWMTTMLHTGNQVIFTTAVSLFQTKDRKPIKEYTRLAQEGMMGEAAEVFYSLQPLRDLWQQLYQVYRRDNLHPTAETKHWAMVTGLLDDARVRPPQDASSTESEALIEAVLTKEGYAAPVGRRPPSALVDAQAFATR